MKIKSIRISNILSFEYKEKIEDAHEIRFDNNLNILIGANGAGKSNFLEIINKIFRMWLVLGCTYQPDHIEKQSTQPQNYSLRNALVVTPRVHNLSKNYSSMPYDMQIRIEIELNENDFSNLIFVQQNAVSINELMLKYSSITPNFNSSVTEGDIKSKSIISFDLKNEPNSNTFVNMTGADDEPSRFIVHYFLYFEFLQNLIKIANEYEGKNWIPLRNTFALISGYRNFHHIDSLYRVESNESGKWEEIRSRITSDSTRESKNEEPVVFSFVKHKLAYLLNHIEYRINNALENNAGKKTAQDFLRDEPFFKNINDLLESNLGLVIDIEHKEKTLDYYFNFKNKSSGKSVQISDLSSGEKGIIHFIFSIYGYDLRDGMIIIDEPELHLHPQIQQKYLDIIFDVIGHLNLQFIIATHSPQFVNSKVIDGLYRFYKNGNKFTKVVKPTIVQNERDLTQILTYTNSAKIFFSDKVILVEGDSDEYFYKYYLNNYKKRSNQDISNIEILNIHGKNNYKRWREFLDKYKIKSYYVGDLDNILENYISQQAITWRQRFGQNLSKNDIQRIKSRHLADYSDMLFEITQKYNERILLLCNGSLEDYVETIIGKEPEFEDVINFCNKSFDHWMSSDSNPEIKNELDYFFFFMTI